METKIIKAWYRSCPETNVDMEAITSDAKEEPEDDGGRNLLFTSELLY